MMVSVDYDSTVRMVRRVLGELQRELEGLSSVLVEDPATFLPPRRTLDDPSAEQALVRCERRLRPRRARSLRAHFGMSARRIEMTR